jgi:hypothetical protein
MAIHGSTDRPLSTTSISFCLDICVSRARLRRALDGCSIEGERRRNCSVSYTRSIAPGGACASYVRRSARGTCARGRWSSAARTYVGDAFAYIAPASAPDAPRACGTRRSNVGAPSVTVARSTPIVRATSARGASISFHARVRGAVEETPTAAASHRSSDAMTEPAARRTISVLPRGRTKVPPRADSPAAR